MARFPDGGKIKMRFYDVALYYYVIPQKRLIRLVDLNQITTLYWKDRYYDLDILCHDSLVYFKFDKPNEKEIKWVKDRLRKNKDVEKLNKAISFVNKIQVYNLKNKHLSSLDNLPNNLSWAKYSSTKLSKLSKSYLDEVPCNAWGEKFAAQFNQSNKINKGYIIYEKGSMLTRKCILEQLMTSLSINERDEIINKMMKYKEKLFQDYKNCSDGTYQTSLKKGKYENYVIYMDGIKNQLEDVH